jgi:hypothetical protein
MIRLVFCEYNENKNRVELRYSTREVLFIDCEAVEAAVDANTIQRAALDYLIYNKPWEYVELVLSGGLEEFVMGASRRDFGLED